jgi:hypothetical protein
MDLDVELPTVDLVSFSRYQPHHFQPKDQNRTKSYAYATFMSTRNPSLREPYFLAVQSLIYRVLWSKRSKSNGYPFIAFVADHVPETQRDVLRGLGAVVRELSPLAWTPNVDGVHARWADLFAKLNMWNETDFAKILFLDADAFPVTNVDAMFDMAPWQKCLRPKMDLDDFLPDSTDTCEEYVLAGVPMNPAPPDGRNYNWNVGSMVISPRASMHRRLLQNYVKADRYDNHMAEQAFLNWQFRVDGPFPLTLLPRKWDGFLPQPDDEGKFNIIHEKLWACQGWLGKEWNDQWQQMLDFVSSGDFAAARKKDGIQEGSS